MISSRPPNAYVPTRADHYTVGVYGDLVILYAFLGSETEPAHITSATASIAKVHRRLGRGVRVMSVLAETRGLKPPSAEVREAVAAAARDHGAKVAQLAVVIAGEGFGVAIHRAALGTLVALVRPAFPVHVAADVSGGLAALLTVEDDRAAILRFCEMELARPTAKAKAAV